MSWQTDGDEHLTYNARDTAYAARVYAGIQRDLTRAVPVTYKLHEIHDQLSIVVAKMYRNGIYVRQDWRGFLQHCLTQSVAETAEAVRKVVGDESFPVTPAGMQSLIFKRHKRDGIKCFELPDPLDERMYTDETLEKISVDENSLLLLLVSGDVPPELVPIIDAWWMHQGEKKRLGYVASHLIDEAIGPDGRLRPGWNSCGTDTMRLACSSPNVMNIEQLLRHILGPPPGRVIVHADKSQLELRVMAVVAHDHVLQEALDTGDVYSFDARQWFGLPVDYDVKKLKPGLRKSAKIIHLGRQYGAGVKTCYAQALRQDRRFTFDNTRKLIKQWDKTYYRTARYWDEEMSKVLECGYSEGHIIGGRRVYPRPPDRSEVANYPIQRTAAEMMNLEILELDRRLTAELPGAQIIIQLHDAIDVECDEKDEAKVMDIMTQVMDREWEFCGQKRFFPVEMKVARYPDTWAEV